MSIELTGLIVDKLLLIPVTLEERAGWLLPPLLFQRPLLSTDINPLLLLLLLFNNDGSVTLLGLVFPQIELLRELVLVEVVVGALIPSWLPLLLPTLLEFNQILEFMPAGPAALKASETRGSLNALNGLKLPLCCTAFPTPLKLAVLV